MKNWRQNIFMHRIKQEAENCIIIHDSISSSCSRKVYSAFLVHCVWRRKHIWASCEQLTIKQCVCSIIYSSSFFMSLELPNHLLRIQIEYLHFLFHYAPASVVSVEIQWEECGGKSWFEWQDSHDWKANWISCLPMALPAFWGFTKPKLNRTLPIALNRFPWWQRQDNFMLIGFQLKGLKC